MNVSSLALLFLLLHSSLQQSGEPPNTEDDEDLEDEIQPDFHCFSKLPIKNILLLCNVTKLPPRMVKNIIFKVGQKTRKWSEDKYVEFHGLDFGKEYNVCIDWKRPRCKTIIMEKIALPDSPNNVTVTYNKDLMEYVFTIILPHYGEQYLDDRRIHQELVLRKEGMPWPDCKETSHVGSYKMCFKNLKEVLHIPKRNLEYSTKYDTRVRSIPTGEYFDGFWSPWSAITSFRTDEEPVTDAGNVGSTVSVALSTSIPFFFLIVVILIAVFWKSRIKPFVWPEIPDHKKTLEKFINKPKQNQHIIFNPEYYEIIPINIIDYIKAQEIPVDNHEIGTTYSNTEKPSINGFSINPSPSEGSTGAPANIDHAGQCQNLGDNRENLLEDPFISGTAALPPGDSVSEKCHPSNDSNGITTVAVKHPGNGFKGLCWEDIYIAMSAFKTPSSAVKQVPKNSF